MKREFYLRDDVSNKSWTIDVIDLSAVTSSGRIGTAPREVRKEFQSPDKALVWAEKQVAAKLRKGYREGAIAELGAWSAPDWASMTVNENLFWRLIGLFDWSKTGDDDAVTARAVKALAAMEIPEINAFSDILATRLHALDTREHCRHTYPNADANVDYISADDFLYARCVVVANGREFYELVLADPAHMPQEMEFESLLVLPELAYEMKTGDEYDYYSPISYESCSNREGWAQPGGEG